MAAYRQVHISFWQDDFVLDLTPEEKYFYLFLMTNSKTTGYGIYEIPKRIMMLETGYNSETIEKLINKFIGYKKIEYDETTKEIFIVNWIKYNPINNRNIYVYVVNEIPKIKSKIILSSFVKILKSYVGKWKGKLNKDDNENTDYIKSLLGLIAPSRGLVSPTKQREREREGERNQEREREEPPLSLLRKSDEDIPEQGTLTTKMQKLWATTWGRNPKIPEQEETEKLIKKFGYDKVKQIYKKASLKGFKNLNTLLEALDENGNIKPRETNGSNKKDSPRGSIDFDKWERELNTIKPPGSGVVTNRIDKGL